MTRKPRHPEFPKLLSQDEINASMGRYPRPQEPVVRLRYIFAIIFAAGIFAGLMIVDPLARMVEVYQ